MSFDVIGRFSDVICTFFFQKRLDKIKIDNLSSAKNSHIKEGEIFANAGEITIIKLVSFS